MSLSPKRGQTDDRLMNNYDFLILSASEFERPTRDLLQKHLGCHIESFTQGRDGGVGLTPANKDEIQQMFTPFIQSTEDILGRDDLNNLLAQHSDIEKQYYKLWLCSTAVLERIVNRRVLNWPKNQ